MVWLPPQNFSPQVPDAGLEPQASQDSQDLLSLAQHQQRQGAAAEAMGLYHQLLDHGTLQAGAQAQRQLQALTGSAGFNGVRAEALADQFVDQVMDPVSLMAMMGAGATYRVARAGLLRGLAPVARALGITQANALGLPSSLGAFALEATAFPLYTGLGSEALGREFDWSFETMGHRIQSSFLILGGLKLFGHVGQSSLRWWQSGRVATGGLSDGLLPSLVPQLSMYGGIVSGHLAEQAFSLTEARSLSQLLLESGVTLVHFNGMGRVLGSVSGSGGLQTLQRGAPPPTNQGARLESLSLAYQEAQSGLGRGGREFSPTQPPRRGQILMMSGEEGSGPGPEKGSAKEWLGAEEILNDPGLTRQLELTRAGDPEFLESLGQRIRQGDTVAFDVLALAAETHLPAFIYFSQLYGRLVPEFFYGRKEVNLDTWSERAAHQDEVFSSLLLLADCDYVPAREVLENLPIEGLLSRMRQEPNAIVQLARLHALGHELAGTSLRFLPDINFLLRDIEKDESALFALGYLAGAGHPQALEVLIPFAETHSTAMRALRRLARQEVPGAIDGLIRIGRRDRTAIFTLREIALSNINPSGKAAAVAGLAKLAPHDGEAISALVDLAFENGVREVIPHLAQSVTQSRIARRMIFERARNGNFIAYEIFAQALPRSRTILQWFYQTLINWVPQEPLPPMEEGVRRIDPRRDLDKQKDRERNRLLAFRALGLVAGENPQALQFLEDVLERHPTHTGFGALSQAAGNNLRAVYALQRLYHKLPSPYEQMAHQKLEQLDVYVRQGPWQNPSPMVLHPLRVLIDHHNPFAVKNLMQRVPDQTQAMQLLLEILAHPSPELSSVLREEVPRTLRLQEDEMDSGIYFQKCKLLGRLAQLGNRHALNFLFEGIHHENSMAFLNWQSLIRDPSPELEELLADPALRMETLMMYYRDSAYVRLVVTELENRGNLTAQNIKVFEDDT